VIARDALTFALLKHRTFVLASALIPRLSGVRRGGPGMQRHRIAEMLLTIGLAATAVLVPHSRAQAQTCSCLQTSTLDCSAPWIVSNISTTAAYFTAKFGTACVRHDYCYRSGYRTYLYTKERCDDMLKQDAEKICDDMPYWNPMKAPCYVAAQAFYQAVHDFGKSSYQTANSSCCAYDGPAIAPACGGTQGQARPPPIVVCSSSQHCCDPDPTGKCYSGGCQSRGQACR